VGRTIELNPVSRITADAMGVPGQRTFYLQARSQSVSVTLLCEKEQINMLSQALGNTLEELKTKFPKGALFKPLDADMSLEYPVEPDFRVGQMGIGYDEENDLVVLALREVQTREDQAEDELTLVRLFCSRAQIEALSRHATEVVQRGRPICPLCGKPMDASGNVEGFCPRRNGHGDEVVFA
jgi:uncharacterized repeat protein (TIGR03847 family)